MPDRRGTARRARWSGNVRPPRSSSISRYATAWRPPPGGDAAIRRRGARYRHRVRHSGEHSGTLHRPDRSALKGDVTRRGRGPSPLASRSFRSARPSVRSTNGWHQVPRLSGAEPGRACRTACRGRPPSRSMPLWTGLAATPGNTRRHGQLWGLWFSTYVVAAPDLAVLSLGRLPDGHGPGPATPEAFAEWVGIGPAQSRGTIAEQRLSDALGDGDGGLTGRRRNGSRRHGDEWVTPLAPHSHSCRAREMREESWGVTHPGRHVFGPSEP